MPQMHKEILTKEQAELLPLIKKFSKKFGLVGGTAVPAHRAQKSLLILIIFS